MRISEFLIIIILIISIILFLNSGPNDVVYVKSDIDDKLYMVRDIEDKQQAANLLARIKQNIDQITKYLNNNIKNYPKYKKYIKQLDRNIKLVIINESDPYSTYTSYTVNKGEELVFCIRSKYVQNNLHSLNLMMYVVIHELAHVACPEHGHTDLFKDIFHFLAGIAIEQKLYKKINFLETPTEYCGLMIKHSII